MSDAELKAQAEEAAAAEEEEQQEEGIHEEVEFSEDDWKASQEEQARSDGWKPLKEFVEAGGDPKQWVSAEMFNVRGEFIGKLKAKDRDLEKKVEDRVAGVKKLYDAKLSELEAARKKAVKNGDDEEFDRLDKQINDLKQEEVPQHPQTPPEVQEWNEKNQWINEDTPKAIYAKAQYAKYVNNGTDPVSALGMVDRDVAREFQESKKPAGHVPASEKGKGSQGFKTKGKQLSMGDLQPEEAKLWKNMPEAWGNDESKFLKAVADARAAEES